MGSGHLDNNEVGGLATQSSPSKAHCMLTVLLQFLVKLSELFADRKGKERGSIFLVQKRCWFRETLASISLTMR